MEMKKTWSAALDTGEQLAVPNLKAPNLRATYLIRYMLENLISSNIFGINSIMIKTYQIFWGDGAVRPPEKGLKMR